jgi:hypothetical protein
LIEQTQLAEMLVAMGCPSEKSAEMASQLDKRARQLSADNGSTYEQSIGYLLELMKQGWAAKERGF